MNFKKISIALVSVFVMMGPSSLGQSDMIQTINPLTSNSSFVKGLEAASLTVQLPQVDVTVEPKEYDMPILRPILDELILVALQADRDINTSV